MSKPSGGDLPVVAQPAESTVGSVVGELVERELTRERERATELVERALKLVTAVGALVTLIFAFVALVPKEKVGVSPQAFWWLVSALVLFVASGVLYLLPLGTPPYRRQFVPPCLIPWLPPTLKALVTIGDTEPKEAYIDVNSWLASWNESAGKALPAGAALPSEASRAASQVIAEARAKVLKDLRTRNKYLLRVVGVAVFADVVALGLLAGAIVQVLPSTGG